MLRWFLIANASHAQLVQEDTAGSFERIADFEHPDGRHPPQRRDRAGWRMGAGHLGGTSLKPPQDARQLEHERFAAQLAQYLEEAARAQRFTQLCVFAAPSLLGSLRSRFGSFTRNRLEAEIPVDLCHVGWAELRARLHHELDEGRWAPIRLADRLA